MRQKNTVTVLLFALFVAVLSMAVMEFCLLRTNVTTDESSYVFQAYAFRDGVWKRPYPPFPSHVSSRMLVAHPEHGWFSRYPPGHALWLLPGVWFDEPRMMVPVAAALSLAVMMAVALRVGVSPFSMAFMLCLSPYFVFMHATLLSHTSGFLAAALMLWAYLSWRRTDRSLFAALAGLAWSWFFLNRTYTALLVAVPFGVDALWVALRRREWRAIKGVLLFALCASVGIGLYLIYNAIMTGDPLLPTYLLCRPSERLGFGRRSVYGVNFMDHTFARGLRVMWRNLLHLDRGLFGFKGSLLAALVLALVGWSRDTVLLLAAAVSVWGGYIFFYFPGIQIAGPVYYFESLPFLLVAAALGLKRIWLLSRSRRLLRLSVFTLGIGAIVLSSVSWAYIEGGRLRERSGYSRQVIDTIESAPPNALVILEDIPMRPYLEELINNPRGLNSDPLIIHTMGRADRVLLGYFSDRPAFIIRGGNESQLEPLATDANMVVELDPCRMSRLTGADQRLAKGGKATRRAREGVDQPGFLAFGSSEWVMPGAFLVEFEMSLSRVKQEAPVTVDVATHGGRTILGRRQVAGDHTNGLFSVEVISDDFKRIEPRIHYGGSGTVKPHKILIRELSGEWL